MNYIYIFISVVLLKFLYNLINYLENFRLYKIWTNYFDKLIKKKKCSNAITYTRNIEEHFKLANISNASIPFSIPIGYGQVATSEATMFENIFANDKRVIPYINNAFLEARGFFKKRMLESFNPMYWLKLIIYLPKNIIKYLGLNTDTIFTKIFQIIFWIADTLLFVIYQDEISIFIKNIINELFSFFSK